MHFPFFFCKMKSNDNICLFFFTNDAITIVAAIVSSNSVNKIVINAHTVAKPFCGHGGHSAPYIRSGVIAKDTVKSVAAIVSSNSLNIIVMNGGGCAQHHGVFFLFLEATK